jgi:hypothetical protein
VDALSEAEKAHYQQDGSHYFLQVGAVTMDKSHWALEDVGALKSSLTVLKTESRVQKAKIAEYEKTFAGLDPEEARTAIAKVKEIGDADSDDSRQKEIEAVRASVEAQYKKQLSTAETTAQTAQAHAEKFLTHIKQSKVREAATAAIEAERGSVHLLLPHVESQCRCAPDQDDPENPELFTIEVVDPKGQPRFSTKGGATGSMTPAEYVSELKANDRYAPAFEGARAAGSGASGSSSNSRTTGRTIRRSDQRAIEANMDRIARGEVTVVD